MMIMWPCPKTDYWQAKQKGNLLVLPSVEKINSAINILINSERSSLTITRVSCHDV